MNKSLKNQVLSCAIDVRKWAEAANARRKRPKSERLNGWCAIASARLWRKLDAIGINSTLHMAYHITGSHVFLTVDDFVIDVTATQFGGQYQQNPVFISHLKEVEHEWFYQSCDVFYSADELRSHQVRTGWVRDQIAHSV